MAKDLNFQSMPLAEEFDVGDDSDMPGYDQPYTSDDVDAILNSGRASVDERRALLARMLDDLQARQGMDESNEYSDLIGRIEDAIAALDEPGDGLGMPGSYGHDADERAMAPDEIMERREDEEAEDREAEGRG